MSGCVIFFPHTETMWYFEGVYGPMPSLPATLPHVLGLTNIPPTRKLPNSHPSITHGTYLVGQDSVINGFGPSSGFQAPVNSSPNSIYRLNSASDRYPPAPPIPSLLSLNIKPPLVSTLPLSPRPIIHRRQTHHSIIPLKSPCPNDKVRGARHLRRRARPLPSARSHSWPPQTIASVDPPLSSTGAPVQIVVPPSTNVHYHLDNNPVLMPREIPSLLSPPIRAPARFRLNMSNPYY